MLEQDLTVSGKQLETAMDIEDLASGVYFLQVYSEQSNRVYKVQKQ